MSIKLILGLLLASMLYAQEPMTTDAAITSTPFPSTVLNTRFVGQALSTINSATIAAGACGMLIPSNTGSVTVTAIDTYLNTVVSAGGSTWNAAIYAAATASGPPEQPTGSALASGTITMSGGNTPSNSWQELALGSNYTATAYGQYCVAWFITNYTGSDSVILKTATSANQIDYITSWTATAWTTTPVFTNSSGAAPDLAIKMSDGSYGTLLGSFPMAGPGSSAIIYNSGSANNEIALRFQLPNSVSAVGYCLNQPAAATNATFVVNLYDANNTALATQSSPNNQQMARQVQNDIYCQRFSTAITLNANAVYRLGVKAATVNSITIDYLPVNANKFLTLMEGGDQMYWSQRSGSGAWTDTNTQRPLIAILVSGWGNRGGRGGQN